MAPVTRAPWMWASISSRTTSLKGVGDDTLPDLAGARRVGRRRLRRHILAELPVQGRRGSPLVRGVRALWRRLAAAGGVGGALVVRTVRHAGGRVVARSR